MSDPTLAEELAGRLRRDILRGQLAPGTPVKERDHATALGVSRTPMREAIRILAQEGLLHLRPARSPIVADPSLKETTDDLTVIMALESLSGRLACAAATDDEIATIADIHTRMEREFEDNDPLDTFEIDMSFHRALALASHNRALAETHGEYMARLWRTRYLTARERHNRDRVVTQHAAILAALEARDPAQIGGAIEHHLGGFFETIEAIFVRRENGDTGSESGDG